MQYSNNLDVRTKREIGIFYSPTFVEWLLFSLALLC